MTDESKQLVKEHWERAVCGSTLPGLPDDPRRQFAVIDAYRYEHDWMIPEFARFGEARGKRVLEVGLGAGSDFCQWVRSGAVAVGRDLTSASVQLVRERLAVEGLDADVQMGDAEHLDVPSDSFDIYYSWGVLHHTPDTDAAIREAHRVLRPGGQLRIMLYRYPSVGALLIWLRYGLLRLRLVGIRRIFAENVESPGTKVYTRRQAARLIGRYFTQHPIEIKTYLWDLDLLAHGASTRYEGGAWGTVRKLYPQWVVKQLLGHRVGSVMTIETVK